MHWLSFFDRDALAEFLRRSPANDDVLGRAGTNEQLVGRVVEDPVVEISEVIGRHPAYPFPSLNVEKPPAGARIRSLTEGFAVDIGHY